MDSTYRIIWRGILLKVSNHLIAEQETYDSLGEKYFTASGFFFGQEKINWQQQIVIASSKLLVVIINLDSLNSS